MTHGTLVLIGDIVEREPSPSLGSRLGAAYLGSLTGVKLIAC